MAMKEAADSGAPTPEFSPEARERAFATNLNTCHIWDEDGDQVRLIRSGGTLGAPLSVIKRLESSVALPTNGPNDEAEVHQPISRMASSLAHL